MDVDRGGAELELPPVCLLRIEITLACPLIFVELLVELLQQLKVVASRYSGFVSFLYALRDPLALVERCEQPLYTLTLARDCLPVVNVGEFAAVESLGDLQHRASLGCQLAPVVEVLAIPAPPLASIGISPRIAVGAVQPPVHAVLAQPQRAPLLGVREDALGWRVGQLDEVLEHLAARSDERILLRAPVPAQEGVIDLQLARQAPHQAVDVAVERGVVTDELGAGEPGHAGHLSHTEIILSLDKLC